MRLRSGPPIHPSFRLTVRVMHEAQTQYSAMEKSKCFMAKFWNAFNCAASQPDTAAVAILLCRAHQARQMRTAKPKAVDRGKEM